MPDIAHRNFDAAFEMDVEVLLGDAMKGYKNGEVCT